MFARIPPDFVLAIMPFCGLKALISMSGVCRAWRTAVLRNFAQIAKWVVTRPRSLLRLRIWAENMGKTFEIASIIGPGPFYLSTCLLHCFQGNSRAQMYGLSGQSFTFLRGLSSQDMCEALRILVKYNQQDGLNYVYNHCPNSDDLVFGPICKYGNNWAYNLFRFPWFPVKDADIIVALKKGHIGLINEFIKDDRDNASRYFSLAVNNDCDDALLALIKIHKCHISQLVLHHFCKKDNKEAIAQIAYHISEIEPCCPNHLEVFLDLGGLWPFFVIFLGCTLLVARIF